jgi:hypothetical protein
MLELEKNELGRMLQKAAMAYFKAVSLKIARKVGKTEEDGTVSDSAEVRTWRFPKTEQKRKPSNHHCHTSVICMVATVLLLVS